MQKEETIIISLGGSLVVPDEVDVEFLKSFRELILSEIEQGKKFIIITGGGKLSRRYAGAAEKISKLNEEQLDWLGIHSTRFNADFVKLLFWDVAEKEIILDPNLPIDFNKPIILGGGWKPGNSTDLVCVLLAKNIGSKIIINLSNTDYVYDSDPKKNGDAKKMENISWTEYRKIIPETWSPVLNTPFDPVASKMAEEEGITVITMNGKPIDNLRKALVGESFQGTTIS